MLCSKTVALTTTITGTCSTTKCVTTSCGTATTSTSTTTKTESEAVTMTVMGDTYPTVDPAGALATSVYNDALSWWSVEEAAYTSLASTNTSQAPAPSPTLGARCKSNSECASNTCPSGQSPGCLRDDNNNDPFPTCQCMNNKSVPPHGTLCQSVTICNDWYQCKSGQTMACQPASDSNGFDVCVCV